MKFIGILYYKLDCNNNLLVKPTIYQDESYEEAVRTQNVLTKLGFKCELYILHVKEENGDK